MVGGVGSNHFMGKQKTIHSELLGGRRLLASFMIAFEETDVRSIQRCLTKGGIHAAECRL